MPRNFTVAEMATAIRQKLELSSSEGLVIMANNGKYMLKSDSVLADVYLKHRDKDGFLYLVYTQENIFG